MCGRCSDPRSTDTYAPDTHNKPASGGPGQLFEEDPTKRHFSDEELAGIGEEDRGRPDEDATNADDVDSPLKESLAVCLTG